MSGYLMASELSIHKSICMLPCGGLSNHDRTDWTADELAFYQVNQENPATPQSLFKSFIFNPVSFRKDHFIHPMFTGFGEQADVKDWTLAIEHFFKKDANLYALNQTALERTEVWAAVPYPAHHQKEFGSVNGKKLDFSSNDDRLTAVKWWIDQFLSRWEKEKASLPKLDFKGFLWQRGSIQENDEPVVTGFTSYTKEKKVFSFWLPFLGSYGAIKCKELGFDASCVHSNYYGNTHLDYNWIIHSTNFAQFYHTGVQIVYGKGVTFNDTHILDYLNWGTKALYMTNDAVVVYHFPKQTMKSIFLENRSIYGQIASFLNKTYKWTPYPGMPYK
ncbi:DUF4855 domain-containing protein [Metabacillus indicus]|uniref:Uncharacterized protein n=1 Tax=Metabacillus indicus TaxID=246786 RepID=A0A084H4C4_METID|nr:DUF4855 domain-containing protein [Metabacillus indicus]KEZ50279.1 hypothetical protein AZ46_0206195 [Metabacillus indicus LMG 22858]KEZ54436.1 hypothetical protein GS18_0205870 [Metabacillus indicus]